VSHRNYDYSSNGLLKRDLAKLGIRYSQVAYELGVTEKTVKERMRVPLPEEDERKIRLAMAAILKSREKSGSRKPNQEFRDMLRENSISVAALARASWRHPQTVRSWLSVPLSPERLNVLMRGYDRIVQERLRGGV